VDGRVGLLGRPFAALRAAPRAAHGPRVGLAAPDGAPRGV